MSDNLWIQETYINESEGHMIGESDVYETYTDHRGELFRDLQREYGRCISKVYMDTPDGPPKTIGWVFSKTLGYEDAPERKYVREVWVTLHSAPPIKTIEYSYA